MPTSLTSGISSYDFYSPTISVGLVQVDKTVIPLWTNAGEVSNEAKKLGLDALSYVTNVTIDISLSHLPVITVQMSPPYEATIALFNSTLIEIGRTGLRVSLGYSSGTNGEAPSYTIYNGLLMEPHITVSPGGSEITLKAYGAYSLNLGERRFETIGLTRLQILNKCLGGPDTNNPRELQKYIVVPSDEKFKPTIDLLNQPTTTAGSGSKSDWDLIVLLCRDVGCWPLLKADKTTGIDQLHLIPMPSLTLDETSRNFYMFGMPASLGPDTNSFPIFSASTEQISIYLPGAMRGVTSGGIASDTRQPNFTIRTYDRNGVPVAPGGALSVQGTKYGVASAGLGLDKSALDQNLSSLQKVLNDPFNGAGLIGGKDATQAYGSSPHLPDIKFDPFGEADGTQYGHGDGTKWMSELPGDGDYDTRLLAQYRDMQGSYGVHLNVDTMGIPDMQPGERVKVFGMGDKLSNLTYGVWRVVHTIGDSGFKTKLELWTATREGAKQYDPRVKANTTEASSDGNGGDHNVYPKDVSTATGKSPQLKTNL